MTTSHNWCRKEKATCKLIGLIELYRGGGSLSIFRRCLYKNKKYKKIIANKNFKTERC